MISSKIICEHIEPWWRKAIISELSSRIDLWKIEITGELEIPADIRASLTDDENHTASKFYHLKDRQNFIVRRGVLRTLLAGYTGIKASYIEFGEGENKKPYLANNLPAPVHFNVSHSGRWAFIGISDQELGVDIEEYKENFNYREILQHGFSDQEANFITGSENPLKSFFQIWTRKEALIKATSKGVDDDLDKIPGLDGNHHVNSALLGSEKDWTIRSFTFDKTCQASIAHLDYNTSINFFNFPITKTLDYRI